MRLPFNSVSEHCSQMVTVSSRVVALRIDNAFATLRLVTKYHVEVSYFPILSSMSHCALTAVKCASLTPSLLSTYNTPSQPPSPSPTPPCSLSPSPPTRPNPSTCSSPPNPPTNPTPQTHPSPNPRSPWAISASPTATSSSHSATQSPGTTLTATAGANSSRSPAETYNVASTRIRPWDPTPSSPNSMAGGRNSTTILAMGSTFLCLVVGSGTGGDTSRGDS